LECNDFHSLKAKIVAFQNVTIQSCIPKWLIGGDKMEILKIGVVGVGGRAGSHLATIPKLKDIYKLVAVCDINEARVQQVAQQYGVMGYTDAEKMLDTGNIDVIVIATPPEGHHIITCQAAERGVHVVTETPMSFSLSCGKLMLDVAEQHGVKLDVSENVRRWPQERLKRKIVESGVLGEITQIHCWYVSGGYHGISAIRNCACSEARRVVGHAANIQLATGHWFDPFCRRAVGTSPHISTMPAQPDNPKRVATWEIGLIDFENGLTAVYEYPIGTVRGNYWEVDATRGQIIGGGVFIHEDGQRKQYPIETVTCEVDGVNTIALVRINTNPPIVWENPHRNYPLTDGDDIARADVLISVYRATTEGIDTDYGVGGYKDLEMLIATRESAMKGSAPIQLPITNELEYDKRQHEEYKAVYGIDPLEIVQTPAWKREATLAAEI